MSLEIGRVVVGALHTNCWILHARGHRDALVVDPGDEPDRILAACAGLDVRAVVLTHAHWDHVLGAPEVAEALGVPILASPAESPVWPHELAHLREHGAWDAGTADIREAPAADRPLWDGHFDPVTDGELLPLGPLTVTVVHTPGHTPGGITLDVAGHLFTGDTLFPGGPGLTGPPLSDFPTVMASVERLLHAPGHTVVHPGHGRDTVVADERPRLPEWRARGW